MSPWKEGWGEKKARMGTVVWLWLGQKEDKKE